ILHWIILGLARFYILCYTIFTMGHQGEKTEISPTVTWRKVNNEAVILNLETSVYYSVNQTGTLIWELLVEGKPLEKIARALAAEYKLSTEQAAEDTCGFLKAVSELGLTVKH
ncbi:MAG TPA: hypothetical protein DER10_03900, partial [Elusimicrobia bacterium]|nr:hypothetical protein [Elusimicrobiota bacterium]